MEPIKVLRRALGYPAGGETIACFPKNDKARKDPIVVESHDMVLIRTLTDTNARLQGSTFAVRQHLSDIRA